MIDYYANLDKAIRDLSLESVYAEGVANKALADLGAIVAIHNRINNLIKNWENECGREGFAPIFAEELKEAINGTHA